MNRRELPETIPISYLNALEYCPRRFYYEFVQGDMLQNEFVLEGTLLHKHADEPGTRTRETGEVQIRRLYLYSEKLRLSGFADLVEEQEGIPIPIEYKHGKEGKWLNDHIQLCAQALCLEERLSGQMSIPYGYVFYFGSRKRLQIHFTDELRARTQATIAQALEIAVLDRPPQPLDSKQAIRCRDCSLRELCLPEEVVLLKQRKKELSIAHTLFD